MQHSDPRAFAPVTPVPQSLSPEDYIAILHPERSIGRPAALVRPEQENLISWTFDREVLMGQLPVYLLSTAYISLNRFRGRRENENLAALNALFVDLDYHATSTWRAKEPEVVQAAYADHLDANGLTQPSIFMQSGRGLYAIWLIRELPPAARQRWRAAQRALIDFSASFGADRACSDEARVFRIPGSTNEKNGKTVSISGGNLQRHGFDALEDQIYRACGRPVRAELQARRAKRAQRTCRTGTHMPRGLTQKQRHEIILDDLEIYRLYLGGQIPEGQRNLFLHIYATCLTHILEARDIEKEVTDMANRAVPDMKQADVRIIVKQAANKAGRPMSTCVWKDDRYAYRGSTIAEKLGISSVLSRSLGLRQIIPDQERRRRRAEAERARRAANGAVSREEYLENNSASRTQPWLQYGLKRSQYYARKKAGTLPELEAA